MKILHVSDYHDPERLGGAARLMQAHAATLAARGHRVLALSGSSGGATEELAPGVPWSSFPYPCRSPADWVRTIAALRGHGERLLGHDGPDLVVFHQPFSADVLLDLVEGAGTPCIYAFHSPWSEEHRIAAPPGWRSRLGAGLRRWLEHRAVSRADRVTTESLHMRGRASQIHEMSEERFSVVPGGVNLGWFHPSADRAALRRKLGAPGEGLLVFALRRLVPRVGVDRLIRAVGLVETGGEPVHLRVGGDGPDARRLRDLAGEVGRGRVHFTGPLGDEEARDHYAAADVSVVPSLALEGFGLSTLESLACGTPVIATPIGANPEVLGPLDRGLIVEDLEPDAIARALADAARGRWLGEGFRRRCRAYAEEFSWERAVDRFLEVAEAVLRRSSDH